MIIREIDGLGRVVVPREFRQQLGIEEGEPLEIFIQDNKIAIEKQTDKDLVEDALTKKEYQGAVQETIEDVQDYLGKISEPLEELKHLD